MVMCTTKPDIVGVMEIVMTSYHAIRLMTVRRMSECEKALCARQ